jgi:glycosyltransferase involved in cell wall biosynthesis
MIVKNESKIIERCLNSARPIIDSVSICDTGSTDETPEIIENWCSENNIPGKVHHKSFINFGYNRTLAVSLAQNAFPDADYLYYSMLV